MEKRATLLGECLGEFLGCVVLILLGCGVGAMTTLFATGAPGEIVHGGWTNITLGWGLAVTMAIYVAGRLSGAHLNPAVTVSLALFRGFPWRKVAPYAAAQTAGAFVGAALVFANYRAAFLKFDPLLEKTAGIFTTFPAFPESVSVGLVDQIIGTAILLLLVFAIADERNQPAPMLAPLLNGLVVVAIGTSFGALHGYAINPSRDLGPRLFVTLAGFRHNGLTDGTGVFWVPLAGPMIGGLLGAAVYEYGIRRFLPAGKPE